MKNILLFGILLSLSMVSSQEKNMYTVQDFITLSKNSLEAKKNEKLFAIAGYNNSIFKKSMLPSVSMNLTLPNYNRSITEVLQPDGTYAFRESNSANSNLGLSISQKIPFTGGEISVSNSLNRLDLFGENDRSTSYSASWVGVNISQPLTFFNSLRWDTKIQEARQQVEYLEYLKAKVKIKYKAINYFFESFKLKKEAEFLKESFDNTIKYKTITEALIEEGKIFSDDSIEVQLKLLKIKQDIKYLKKQFKLTNEIINDFFQTESNKVLLDSLTFPTKRINIKEPQFYIDTYLNIYETIKKSTLLATQKRIKQLQSSRFYNANLNFGFGFNNSSDNIDILFQSPNQSQNFSLSIRVPLLDFEKSKTELKVANNQLDVEVINLTLEKKRNIDRIKYLCSEISSLYEDLEIENSRIELLKIKLKRMGTLLKLQRILLYDYNEVENALYTSIKGQIDMTHSIYSKVNELEELTILEIL